MHLGGVSSGTRSRFGTLLPRRNCAVRALLLPALWVPLCELCSDPITISNFYSVADSINIFYTVTLSILKAILRREIERLNSNRGHCRGRRRRRHCQRRRDFFVRGIC